MEEQIRQHQHYSRVLIKISGEALMGNSQFGLDPPTVERVAREISEVHRLGVEICLVIGGGNISIDQSSYEITGPIDSKVRLEYLFCTGEMFLPNYESNKNE